MIRSNDELSDLAGVEAVLQPDKRTATLKGLNVVIAGRHSREIFRGIKATGADGVVIDMTEFPPESRLTWVKSLDGFAQAFGLTFGYTGLPEIETAEDPDGYIAEYITPRTADTPEEAVELLEASYK